MIHTGLHKDVFEVWIYKGLFPIYQRIDLGQSFLFGDWYQ